MIHISMDKFWTKDGQPYKFDRSRLQEAIDWTQKQYLEALPNAKTVIILRGLPGSGKSSVAQLFADKGDDFIVVDNTHTRAMEMEFYIKRAEEEEIRVHILHVERGLYEAAFASTHDVPWEKMTEMASRWEPVVTRDPIQLILAVESEVVRLVGKYLRRDKEEKVG